MRTWKTVLVTFVAASILWCVAGCGDKARPGGKILARIGPYELTTEDFNDEAGMTALSKSLTKDPKQAKRYLLDEMIDKKILLQEAQREDFDKDKAFMKEIERYWEQALLKLLFKKKMEEISHTIVVSEREVLDEYDRMSQEAKGNIGSLAEKTVEIRSDVYNRKMQAAYDEWLDGLRKKAHVKKYEENL